jgi:hypothetical protein
VGAREAPRGYLKGSVACESYLLDLTSVSKSLSIYQSSGNPISRAEAVSGPAQSRASSDAASRRLAVAQVAVLVVPPGLKNLPGCTEAPNMAACASLRPVLCFAGIAFAARVPAAGLALLRAVPLREPAALTPLSPTGVAPGAIASVRCATQDIRFVSPDGAADPLVWTAARPLTPAAAQDLAWQPD